MNRADSTDGSKEVALRDTQAALSFLCEFLIQIEMFGLIKILLHSTSQLYCKLGDCERWMVFIKANRGSST